MKRTGALSGVWDIFLSVPKNGKCGMYIEIKVGRNKLTDNQSLFYLVNSKDYEFIICCTLDEFRYQVSNYLK